MIFRHSKVVKGYQGCKAEPWYQVVQYVLNLPQVKRYNDTYSDFAYELDRLAFEEDILIIMSLGNFDQDALGELLSESYNPSHDIPHSFMIFNRPASTIAAGIPT